MTQIALLVVAASVGTAAWESSASSSLQSLVGGLWFTVPAAFFLGVLGASQVRPPIRGAAWIGAGLGVGPLLWAVVFIVPFSLSALQNRPSGGDLGSSPDYFAGAITTIFSLSGIAAALYAISGFLVAWLGAEIADLRASRADRT